MVLSQEELRALIEVRQHEPHQLLGMHQLGDGAGLVARAFVPDAAKVEIEPVHEKDKPAFKLTRLHKSGLFEGTTTEADRVYAYDLVITDQQGRVRRTRDPYSFLPTMGEADLFLFGKGDERRMYDKLGAQLRTIDGVAGTALPFGRPTRSGSAWWAISTSGMAVITRCGRWARRACGRSSSRAWAKGPLQVRGAEPARARSA